MKLDFRESPEPAESFWLASGWPQLTRFELLRAPRGDSRDSAVVESGCVTRAGPASSSFQNDQKGNQT